MSASKAICKICNAKESQYKCPKCALEYCSLACFKDTKHSRCTEKFYQDQVKESLKSEKVSELSDERDKMMKILEKLRNLGDLSDLEDEESENESLLDALEELNLADLNDLSVKELEELLGVKHLNKVNELIEQGVTKEWLVDSEIVKIDSDIVNESWFLRFKPSTVVLNEELPDYVPFYKPSDIPNIQKLTTKAPSDFLWNNLVEISVIYSFVYTQFSADELKDVQVLEVEIVPIVLELCSTFQAKTFVSAVEALESAKSAIDFNSVQHDMKEIFNGALKLFSHPKMLIIMLMDMHGWFSKLSKCDKNAFLAGKKVLFLAAWLESEMAASKGSIDEILKTLSNIIQQFSSD